MRKHITVELDISGRIIIADNQKPTMHVREFIAAIMKNRGLTAGRVQILSGIAHPSVGQYLNGKSESMKVGVGILNTLGYDVTFKGEA